MNTKIRAYRNVFDRNNPIEVSFEDLIKNPDSIFKAFNISDAAEILQRIAITTDKAERNEFKRNNLPAVDISPASILSIDIDGIADSSFTIQKCVSALRQLDSCLAIKQSVSGNLVAFFRYSCKVEEFPFLYYKLYLELVLKLSVNIDFLPEIGRLRYVSGGTTFHYNPDSRVLTEILNTGQLPYINASVGKEKARTVIYGSR